jgi:hypothetical protein
MKRYFNKIALLTAAIAVGMSASYSQIFISSVSGSTNGTLQDGAAIEWRENDTNPSKIEETENSEKGVIFPKVPLGGKHSLWPLCDTIVEKKNVTIKDKSKGMVVYNTTDAIGHSGTKLHPGLMVWDGAEWLPLLHPIAYGEAECNGSLSQAMVKGYYAKGLPLVAEKNYITIPVNVTKTGAYNAEGVVFKGNTDLKAAFAFSGSGEFTQLGLTYITLSGHGEPNTPTSQLTDSNRVELHINNNVLSCNNLPKIFVEDQAPNFAFNCDSVKVIYTTGKKSIDQQTPISSTNNVQIKIDLLAANIGVACVLQTDTLNGISFTASYTPSVLGRHSVTLQGQGTPLRAGAYLYTITGNDANQVALCTAKVTVAYTGSAIAPLLFSNSVGGDSFYDIGARNSAVYEMMQADTLFGLGRKQNVPVIINSSIATSNNSNFNNYTSLSDYGNSPLVFISKGVDATLTSAVADVLCEYVKKGKTCIFAAGSANSNIAEYIIRKLSGTSGNYTTTTGSTATSYSLLEGNPIINGFYSLDGKKLGCDAVAANNFLFTNLPDDWMVLASNDANPRNAAKLIMHKKYRMVLAANDGMFTGGANPTNLHPVKIDGNNSLPLPCSDSPWNGTNAAVYNGYLLANLLIWAFEAVGE